jgi:CRISPR/Cas system-associated exonuclease Cas4 (RecB family)
MFRIVTSTSAASRLGAAIQFLDSRSPSDEVLVVGASRGAADDLVRGVAERRGATMGLSRFSLTELAARAAASALADKRQAPASDAGAEALAARVVFDAMGAGELAYFAPVAEMPGFPRALARTLHELRLARVTPAGLEGRGPAAADIARLLARIEQELARASTADRASLFHMAAGAWRTSATRWAGLPVLLLDVAINSRAEREFIADVVARAPEALATVPHEDARTFAAFASSGAAVEELPDAARPASDLSHLRRYVFTSGTPPERSRAGDVRLFSAPGEGREALEIARRLLMEAKAGVPFDEMAVFLRAPQQYLGLLDHACARAGVPVYFDRGTRRPDPAGRAFVALLSSAVEGLSAKRFDEYLSLGQVPSATPRARDVPALPRDEVFAELIPDLESDGPDADVEPAPMDSESDAILAGTLRAPWKWEELIVESAVVGGRGRGDGKARWRRRLDGLSNDYLYRRAELAREEPDSPRLARLARDLVNLDHLRAFALPLIDVMAGWPDAAKWGDWLDLFAAMAPRALARPDRVLRVLADLRPMADVGPVSLEEARDVLHDRLVALDWDPPARRYGSVFVGTPHQARGRVFRVVFVPGLAERLVPQRPREDPLLLDERRRAIDADLARQDERSSAERLLLKIAIGAAGERLYLSYPRMDVAETRARVPSFYALDVMRAITGRVPDYRELAEDAGAEGDATLAWPAPTDPARAVDDLEHDLAVLKPLLESRDRAAVKGRAHYMLGLNDALRRSVISRWARGRTVWSASDGLIKPGTAGARALERHRLSARAYSLSALQRFATCPYQFLLATIHRLEPWDEPEPLMRLDPLTRGSLFHQVQAEFYRELKRSGALPIVHAAIPEAIKVLDAVLDREAAEYEERLAPAIERVWRDEIGELRRDLGIWVRKLADQADWMPRHFEFSFGLRDEGRDPESLKEPVTIDGRFVLHGSVDLIEEHAQLGVLRVTDHKTGKNRSNVDLIVGGGATLQPVLYSAAIEEGLKKTVFEGRLFYCTTAGGFGEHKIPINDYTRRQGLEVLTIIDRAVERGWLVAAPGKDACRWCDFRSVCGPREQERIARKNPRELDDLRALRSMR